MLNKTDVAKAALVALVLGAGQPLAAKAAGDAIGIVAVSAVVQPSALVRVELLPTQFAVSEADIERGSIEIPAGSFVRVNAGRIVPAVVLDLSPGEGALKSPDVHTHQFGAADGGFANARVTKRFAEQAEKSHAVPSDKVSPLGSANAASIAYRFVLSGKARPARVPAPLILNIAL
jgi:hypothetical protein